MHARSQKSVFAVIPARGGSKGLPRKNIRLVGGKPLVAYTIEAAVRSRRLTSFATSTEDDEIAKVARSFGSPVVQRPVELAADAVPWLPVVRHALAAVEPEHGVFDYVMILQAPTPLRTSEDIDAAIDLIVRTRADTVVGVYQVGDYHPVRMYRIEGERLIPYAKEPPDRRRQSLEPVFHRNGAIYVFRRSLIEEEGTHMGPDLRPYVMPRDRSINIHDEMDLAVAEILLSKRASHGT